ncbi:uncharacterized protein LOC128985991 isoform X2 [Macrosteles quadrilineatus]|uniref:uncharacterized protein LOC128985991 isoform X2 n=1 Tax=Macrosteles quadrilineatus TaxID=74068 RepID=UPI0023E345E7|nr:uncharacterized protein LOC128985991 isoform X2 [Macrosteles quadrilineatus]
MAQSPQPFLGSWEITMCIIQPGSGPSHQEPTGIEGTIMLLEENGDVTWSPASGAEGLPLFTCETYDVLGSSMSGVAIRFGAYQGHIIEFRVDQPEAHDQMLMICDGWCVLHCRRSSATEPSQTSDATFSLLPALEDGYFSDLTIASSNEKKFAVHTCILQLSAPELDWTSDPPPLSGLREDVLGTILHYLYTECLPANLSEGTAHQCITAAASYPCLASLVTLCQHYLRNITLKQQIMSLVNDMHTCASHIIQHLNAKSSGDSLNTNPAKLCFVVRQSLREAAVACVKLLVLCDLFSKRKGELTRDQRHEIIRYAKSRLPIFMNQLHRFLVGLKITLSSMSSSQRQEIATYLVPEIETILDTLSSLGLKFKQALESIISAFNESSATHKHCSEHSSLLSRTLHEVLHKRDLNKLKNLLQRHSHSLFLLLQRKEGFNELTSGNKVRSVSRSLEQLVEELPVFLLRLEEVTAALDDKLEWREFKFCFKVGSSKVSGLLQRLLSHSAVVQPVLTQLCSLVARDAFTQALASLGLVDPVKCSDNNHSTPNKTHQHSTPKHHGYKLNLVECLCVPPISRNSRLSAAAIQLLRSGANTDMVFEVVPSPEGESVINQVGVEVASEEACTISAHRVIVAARCDWFRRALLSGMREAIDRKIIVFDTSPSLFSVLLDYLYCGQLDTSSFTVDQLADLMLLADRYEVDSLKTACEHGLSSHIDHDSVLYFLSMGDQFNAKHLRSSCLNFISKNPDIMDSELFEELPQNLQAEIYDLVIWAYAPSKMGVTDKLGAVTDLTAGLSLSDSDTGEGATVADSSRLEACLRQLHDIIGDEGVSRQQLVQVALAADFDLNRALNFYYSS